MRNKLILLLVILIAIILALTIFLIHDLTGGEASQPEESETQTEPPAENQTEQPNDDAAEQSGEDDAAAQPAGDDAAEQPAKMAPDFTVTDLEGNEVHLSDFLGKPVILNFWASWCGPCKNEMPDFEDAYQEYGDEIVFMMVNLTDGYSETVETASSFLAGTDYTFPVYYDTLFEASSTYGVSAIPTTYFIGADGSAIAMGQGMLNREALQRGIDMILPQE